MRHIITYPIAALILIASICSGADQSPIVQIETGGHNAAVRALAADANEQFAITAAEDGTARIWDIAAGKLLRILGIPMYGEKAGALQAAALSPDGLNAAVSGNSESTSKTISIYVFDRRTGGLVHRIADVPNAVHMLAYSPDGRYSWPACSDSEFALRRALL